MPLQVIARMQTEALRVWIVWDRKTDRLYQCEQDNTWWADLSQQDALDLMIDWSKDPDVKCDIFPTMAGHAGFATKDLPPSN